MIPLMLFLDMVPSSFVHATRVLRGCFRGGFVYVLFQKRSKASNAAGTPFLVYFIFKEGKEGKEGNLAMF